MSQQPTQEQQPRPRGKRAYAAPRLTEYGSVAALTQGGGSRVADGGSSEKRLT
jgi:hypothetical protein